MPTQEHSPLTFEEHRDLSRELKETHLRIAELHNLVMSLYGAEHRASLAFATAEEVLSKLRNEMQSQAAADLPGATASELYR